MMINFDCVRDVLLYIEENNDFDKYINSNEVIDNLKNKYSYKEIMYTINQLHLNKFINIIDASCIDRSQYIIKCITPNGHDFICEIKNKSNWNKIKNIAKKLGKTSINGLFQTAINVGSEIIISKIK